MKIISVVGARPNFMKIAPLQRAFNKFSIHNSQFSIKHLICHTGQHYDDNMSRVFFEDLELPKPDFYLGISNGTHAEQTARIMIEFEKVLLNEKPDLVIVVGDVNSTIACSLTAVKLGIKVAHVEAGLRSFDWTMPEEINRILTDKISDFLFVTEKSGVENLKREGVEDSKIFFVGNTMIDSLIYFLPKIESVFPIISKQFKINNQELITKNYILVTLHRPSNVDNPVQLRKLIQFLNKVSDFKTIIFPIHPRTRQKMEANSLLVTDNSSLIFTEPLGYLNFLSLIKNASFVITDSGGIQEETTYLGVPCVTLRNTTERPITVEIGTNYLAGEDLEYPFTICKEILNGGAKKGDIPVLWDGKTAERIVDILTKSLTTH